MNRRLFATGVAAMAGTGTVAAQEATPTNDPSARTILESLLYDVIRDGEVSAIAEYIDTNAIGIDAATWDLADMRSRAEGYDGTVSLEVQMSLGEADRAMVLVRARLSTSTSYDIFIAARVKGGKITSYRWIGAYA